MAEQEQEWIYIEHWSANIKDDELDVINEVASAPGDSSLCIECTYNDIIYPKYGDDTPPRNRCVYGGVQVYCIFRRETKSDGIYHVHYQTCAGYNHYRSNMNKLMKLWGLEAY